MELYRRVLGALWPLHVMQPKASVCVGRLQHVLNPTQMVMSVMSLILSAQQVTLIE